MSSAIKSQFQLPSFKSFPTAMELAMEHKSLYKIHAKSDSCQPNAKHLSWCHMTDLQTIDNMEVTINLRLSLACKWGNYGSKY